MAWFWYRVKTCELGFVLHAAFKVPQRSRQVIFSYCASCPLFAFCLSVMEVSWGAGRSTYSERCWNSLYVMQEGYWSFVPVDDAQTQWEWTTLVSAWGGHTTETGPHGPQSFILTSLHSVQFSNKLVYVILSMFVCVVESWSSICWEMPNFS